MKVKLLKKIRNKWSISWEEDMNHRRKDLNRIVFGSKMCAFVINGASKKTRRDMIYRFWNLCMDDIEKYRTNG